MGSSGAQHEHAHAMFCFISSSDIWFRDSHEKRACVSLQNFLTRLVAVDRFYKIKLSVLALIVILCFTKYLTCVFVIHFMIIIVSARFVWWDVYDVTTSVLSVLKTRSFTRNISRVECQLFNIVIFLETWEILKQKFILIFFLVCNMWILL